MGRVRIWDALMQGSIIAIFALFLKCYPTVLSPELKKRTWAASKKNIGKECRESVLFVIAAAQIHWSH